jgi:N-acetylmuramoyl-L-alanine amidase
MGALVKQLATAITGLALTVATAGACDANGAGPGWFGFGESPSSTGARTTASAVPRATTAARLAGKVVVIDAGHQLGNHNFPARINRLVNAGGFRKPCNTTGTATNAGYPEATFAWRVALHVRTLLEDDGVRVLLTRTTNSESDWGPCIDVRGRRGNPGQPGPTADVKLSIHGDGTFERGAHGFHVIAPRSLAGWTDRIAAPSLALARTVRDRMVARRFATSTYTGRRGVEVRGDLGTLNWSRRPAVLVEAGNMRSRLDAGWMTSRRGQARLARALVDGLERYLTR